MNPRWYVLLIAGILAIALTLGIQAVSAQRGGGSPPPPAELDYLCVNGYTDIIRDVASPTCQPHESLLILPDDYPFLACANNYTSVLRFAGDDTACRSYETAVPMPPDEGGTLICVMPHTHILKHISNPSFCPGSGTIAGVVPAPETVDDSYQALTNVPISVPEASGVLVNDTTNTGVVSAYDPTSANGGTVAVEPDGSFHYTPPPGFTGTDSFTYTLSNSSGNIIGTVTVEISGPVFWFVDNSAAVNGDGSLDSPFNTLASVNDDGVDPDAPGEFIYLFESATAYSGGIVLEPNQTLVGQETGLAATSVTVPPFAALPPVNPSDAAPTITNTAGDGITLAPSALVTGLTVDNTSGPGVRGTGFSGDVMLDQVSVTRPGNGDPAVELTNIDGTITLTNSTVAGRDGTQSGGAGIFVTGAFTQVDITGGTIAGGRGASTDSAVGGTGGIGVISTGSAVTITEPALVQGGNGGASTFNTGGNAGTGIVSTGGSVTIAGATVRGGAGGISIDGNGGPGGGGIQVSGGSLLIDAAAVMSGNGGTGGSNIGANGTTLDIDDTDVTITGSTIGLGTGDNLSSGLIVIANDGGTGSVAATLTNNILQTPSASIPSLLVQPRISTASICLNASGNSNGAGGAPVSPFVLDNNGGFLGITQTTELALSEDNNDVVVQTEGMISFSCTQG